MCSFSLSDIIITCVFFSGRMLNQVTLCHLLKKLETKISCYLTSVEKRFTMRNIVILSLFLSFLSICNCYGGALVGFRNVETKLTNI